MKQYRFIRYVNQDVLAERLAPEVWAGWRVVGLTLDWDEYYLVALESDAPPGTPTSRLVRWEDGGT